MWIYLFNPFCCELIGNIYLGNYRQKLYRKFDTYDNFVDIGNCNYFKVFKVSFICVKGNLKILASNISFDYYLLYSIKFDKSLIL